MLGRSRVERQARSKHPPHTSALGSNRVALPEASQQTRVNKGSTRTRNLSASELPFLNNPTQPIHTNLHDHESHETRYPPSCFITFHKPTTNISFSTPGGNTNLEHSNQTTRIVTSILTTGFVNHTKSLAIQHQHNGKTKPFPRF